MLFCGIYYVHFYSINDCPVSRKWNGCFLDLSFIGQQLFSEEKLYLSTSLISTTTLHIEIISLVDGMYELIQKPDGNIFEVQTKCCGINWSPEDSEELKLTDFIDVTKGKPRCIILLFYATYYYFLVHLSYWSWMKT